MTEATIQGLVETIHPAGLVFDICDQVLNSHVSESTVIQKCSDHTCEKVVTKQCVPPQPDFILS